MLSVIVAAADNAEPEEMQAPKRAVSRRQR
jgi:hypothetical protein